MQVLRIAAKKTRGPLWNSECKKYSISKISTELMTTINQFSLLFEIALTMNYGMWMKLLIF